jgi:septal ring factor EnvC (AmiA/AmiB activator)
MQSNDICQRAARNIRHFSDELNSLGRERMQLLDDVSRVRADLRDLGIGISELEVLSSIPDTGSVLDEISRRRRTDAAINRLRAALIRVRRRPGILVDATLAVVQSVARTELGSLHRLRDERIGDYNRMNKRLSEIQDRAKNLNRMMDQASDAQRANSCV